MASFRAKMKAKFGKEDASEASPAPVEDEEISEDSAKRERHAVQILRKVRNKLIARRLEGSIDLALSAGLKTSSYSCEVTPESHPSEEEEQSDSPDASGMRSMDMLLNNLGFISLLFSSISL